MKTASLMIDGQRVDVATVFVQLHEPKSNTFVLYCLDVPLKFANHVFYSRKSNAATWSDYIWSEIAAYGGSFMIAGYLENLGKRSDRQPMPYQWVLTTLDEVVEDAEGIRLIGKAVHFDAQLQLPQLKPLH